MWFWLRLEGMSSSKRGPKADRGHLKDSILNAAARVFATSGFIAATMQSIADEAEVDKKLVHYYFGSKEDLFVAMLERTFNQLDGSTTLAAALKDPKGDGLEHYVTSVLSAFEDPQTGPALISILRSLGTYPPAAKAFMRFISTSVMALSGQSTSPHADRRITVMGSQLNGFLTARYLLHAPAIATIPIREATKLILPALRATLTTISPR